MKSMTGYGRANREDDRVILHCEVKQVNHRFLDLWLKLPDSYSAAEQRFRAAAGEGVRRGRVEVKLTRSYKPQPRGADLSFDDAAIGRALAVLTHLKESHGIPGVIDLPTLLSFPGIGETFQSSGAPEEPEVRLGLEALREALTVADSMRRDEGLRLATAIELELAAVETACARIGARAGANAAAVLQRLRDRLAELARDVALDDRRLAEEAALYVDRLDITEELQRVASHLSQMRGFLGLDESVGKRLDFLLQELMREVNTIGSKSRDAEISHEVVELKAALERAREQVQNVE